MTPPLDPSSPSTPPLLEIANLSVAFSQGRHLPIRDLSLALKAGEVAGLVGESGSGKSLTAFSLMGLLPHGAKIRGGKISFEGLNLLALDPQKRRSLCGSAMGMIFQEPLSALNPVITIGEQVAEIFRYKAGKTRQEAKELSLSLLSQVGLPNPKAAFKSYPHRFSGGMRQRVVIAMALALNPALVVADEPTTALDPTIALQIINLLRDLTAARNSGVLFITHNLRILEGFARKVFVMYAGLILEETERGLKSPVHPYTQGLVRALPPNPSERSGRALIPIPGGAPGPSDDLPGCPFAPRCPEREERCALSLPPLKTLREGLKVRCFRRETC